MSINGKPLLEITESDLTALITNGEKERKIIEFKVILPGTSDDEKREFLADVSSFANAVGGDIIYGIKEENGYAQALPGVECENPDAEILRLESSISSGIQPRLIGVETHYISLQNGKYVFIISIPQSWLSPHMVTFRNYSRFFSRHTNGKLQMDIQEIRTAVLSSDNLSTRIRNFHLERVSKVINFDTPVSLNAGAKIVLHMIPMSSFQSTNMIDLKQAGREYIHIETLHGKPTSIRFNIDGLVTWNSMMDDVPCSYTQVFRNGIIETVDGYLLRKREGLSPSIPSASFEQSVIEASSKLLGFLRHSGVIPPIYIFMSLCYVRGYSLGVSSELQRRHYWLIERHDLIDRENINLPDIMVDSYDDLDLGRLLRPAFDAVWNACGWPESENYDQDGNYRV